MYDFNLVNLDTDSITICKKDQSAFTPEECNNLLNEINATLPEKIKFDHDGIYLKVLVFKAKNYVLWDGKKLKTKGSALKSSTLEKGFQEFIQEIVSCILNDRMDYVDVYNKYLKRIWNIKTKDEMKLFASKKTISNTTYDSERTNEKKIVDAIYGTEYVVGDKVHLFFKEDESLCLVENFDGNYDKMVLVSKLEKCIKRFDEILDMSVFERYSLKKNKQKLLDLVKDL